MTLPSPASSVSPVALVISVAVPVGVAVVIPAPVSVAPAVRLAVELVAAARGFRRLVRVVAFPDLSSRVLAFFVRTLRKKGGGVNVLNTAFV
jgi:hypothetical protein